MQAQSISTWIKYNIGFNAVKFIIFMLIFPRFKILTTHRVEKKWILKASKNCKLFIGEAEISGQLEVWMFDALEFSTEFGQLLFLSNLCYEFPKCYFSTSEVLALNARQPWHLFFKLHKTWNFEVIRKYTRVMPA